MDDFCAQKCHAIAMLEQHSERRRVLKIVRTINSVMHLAAFIGVFAQWTALQADVLNMLGDPLI